MRSIKFHIFLAYYRSLENGVLSFGIDSSPLFFFTQHFSSVVFRVLQCSWRIFIKRLLFLQLENPDPSWLSDKAWDELCRMCDLRGFKDFRFVNA